MTVFITKETNSTLVSLVGSNDNRVDYYINTASNLIVKDNVLKIIFDDDILNTITIDYANIDDKLGTDTLTEYVDAIVALNYFEIASSGGSTATTTATTFTGTVIPLDGYYTQDNTSTDTATWTLGATVVNGAAFDILINQATEPTITGATKIPATAAFQANKLSVIKGTVIQGVVYYYFLALAA